MSRLAMVSVIGSLAAACSTETLRFSENPFSNPFKTADASADPARTGSISEDAPRTVPMPRSSVRSEPLAPVRTGSLAAPSAAPKTAAATAAGWSTAGGTTVTVGAGDTINSISSRYGVPSTAILSANGMSASEVAPGRRLVIPVYSATGGAGEARPHRTVEAPSAPVAPPVGRVVASSRIDVKKPEPKSVAEVAKPRTRPGQVAKAPEPVTRVDAKAPVRVAQAAPKKVVAPPKPEPKVVAKVEPAKPEPKPAKVAKIEPAKPEPKPAKVAKAEPPKPEPVKAAPVEVAKAPVKEAAKEPESTGTLPAAEASPGFRWPARGRVIAGYGGGGSNEGINIAVPDGTPVKAAGDGVVAYAGSEVKGYGNLVLIRHDNGYVSAYAHNGDLDVKRGQKVTRGQTIAKSGQSGNVTSPQLHFEIRKGSTPVDPMRYLANAS